MAKGDSGYVRQDVASQSPYGGGNRFLGALGAGLSAAGGSSSSGGTGGTAPRTSASSFMPMDQRPWQQQVIESIMKVIEERNRPELAVQRAIEKFRKPNIIMSAYPDSPRDMSYRYGRDGDF